MKITIGAITIDDVSLDELDVLIERYGHSVAPSADTDSRASTTPKNGGGATNSRSATDSVLLRKFIESAPSGVPTADVGSMLGKAGKAIRPAAKEWAHRVGLTSDASTDPFHDCRVGMARGMRLSSAMLEVAKELAK